ncbi:MAG: aminotransferase class V-fold PLP-dependent enzyme [Flavobacteriales bacterium]|nr:aminotransferase class V-fold PLP-dependent enzyme [Flavobacteriales bacterium]
MKCQKELFSLESGIHYLNCGYKAPLLKISEEAAIKALVRDRNPWAIKPEDFFSDSESVKNSYARIVNAQSDEIAIIPSVSYGLSSILKNIRPKEGGKAITLMDEFPSGYFSLERWCRENKNELKVIGPGVGKSSGRSWNEEILKQIDGSASVVLISSIHWMNGIRYDLKEIGKKCRENGAVFVVDGTQSVGSLPINVKECNINAMVCAGYKWLMGPYSLALAYFDDSFYEGTPLEESWMNRTNSAEFSNLTQYDENYRPGAGRYNVGETSNFILMPLLSESLKQIEKWRPENIQDYCHNLIKPLKEYLNEIGSELESEEYFCNHLFALSLPERINMEKLKSALSQNRVIVSVRGKYIRVSVNVFNDENDLAKLIQSIESTL